jgi:hypothetical protein
LLTSYSEVADLAPRIHLEVELLEEPARLGIQVAIVEDETETATGPRR